MKDGFVLKKKGGNDNNNGQQQQGGNQSERDKWNREYGMKNANAGEVSPISQMNEEMQQYGKYNRRPSQSMIHRPPNNHMDVEL